MTLFLSYSKDDGSGNTRGILRVTAAWDQGAEAHSKKNYSKAAHLFDTAAQDPESYLTGLGNDINRFAGTVEFRESFTVGLAY